MKAQIEELDRDVEIAAERYNAASEKHAKLVVERDKAAARARKANKKKNYLQGHLRGRAEKMYRSGPLEFVEVLLSAKSYEQFTTTWDVLRAVNKKDAKVIVQLKKARREALAAKKRLSIKERAAAEQQAEMASNKRSIENTLASRKDKLRGIEREIAAIEAAERAAARRRAAAAAAASYSGGGGGGGNYPTPTIPAHGNVVDYAKSRLGLPYVWGASGPNSFDCSGLTMWCYAQIGISLPHHSGSQIGVGQRVSRADLQPGDLVFFGSPIHHVGMYVGGGQMIHAPHSGAVVRYDNAFRSDYVGACRP
ncbi:MAG: C40 family peptidase [Coriobacteriales bacterium]|nr:C40 family peptidase [Coriobacteriales bacterium]